MGKKPVSVVTGASGHIGYPLILKLLEKGEEVRILIRSDEARFNALDVTKVYGDVTDKNSLLRAFKGADYVYHLAGVISVDTNYSPVVWSVNVDGTKNVIEACKESGVKRLIYASSVDAYPPLPSHKEMTELSRFNPNAVTGTYAKSKAVSTNMVFDAQSDDLDVVVTYPGACLGPYDYKVSEIGQIVRMYMKKMFPITMSFGHYNFVDVRDVADGMYNAAHKGIPGTGYILTNAVITVDQLLSLLASKTGISKGKISIPQGLANFGAVFAEGFYKISKKDPLFTRYTLRKLVSNANFSHAKAAEELGYNPRPLYDSVSDMVDWIRENDKNMK